MARDEAEWLKAALHIKGWTLVRLAEDLDLCKQTVSGVLHGKRSQKVEQAIARILEQPVEVVFPERYGSEDGSVEELDQQEGAEHGV